MALVTMTIEEYKQHFRTTTGDYFDFEVTCHQCQENLSCLDSYVQCNPQNMNIGYYLCPSCAVGDD